RRRHGRHPILHGPLRSVLWPAGVRDRGSRRLHAQFRPADQAEIMSRPTRLLAAVAVIVVAGCASDVASDAVLGRDTVIVHGGDSVSVRIVHSTPDTVQRWRISGTPLLDIGAGDSEENTLYQVRGAYRLQDGRVVVADAGSLQLRYFDVAGALDAVIGRSGEGPGEFR